MIRTKFISLTIITLLIIIAIFAGLYYSNYFTPPPIIKAEPLAVDTYATNQSVSYLVDSMNSFSCDFYQNLDVMANENIFFSPYSVFVALAMTYEGAKNETANEMKLVLDFPQNNDTMLCSFGRLFNLYNQHKTYTLQTANALWTQYDFEFLPSYLQFIESYYMGNTTNLDFSKTQEAANQINQWIEDQTHGKIKDMIQSNDINPFTKMILTNAIYFKGDWKYQFDAEKTKQENFFVSNDTTVTVPMMQMNDESITFNYMENNDTQFLELPYKGDNLSMLFLLPKDNDITSLEQQLSWSILHEWTQSMSKNSVNIKIPKFTFETKYSLKEPLKSMGMVNPFTSSADFSGMNGYKNLFIDKVLHNAFIQVDETGTEAAAATTVTMVLTSMPPSEIVFHADHPFLFFIQHNQTGNILFMGKVTNPE